MPAVWPPPVRPGDRVGVAALSGAVDPAALERGLASLRELGFVPVPARNLEARWGIFAGGDDARLDAFHELVADESLAAVFFVRGGYGSMRLLPRLDWELVGRRPRAWVGYSDLTPFLLQVVRRWGLVTFHGPMVATDMARGLGEDEATSLLCALGSAATLHYPLRWLRAEEAEGPVLGGCLSLLTAVVGTPWATPLEGALLFLEDLNEPLYKIDRMLTHLRLSGNLTGVHGMLGGYLGGEWEQAIGDETQIATSWHRDTLLALDCPVAWGVPCGHGVPNLTLPLGAHGRLDVANGRLEVAAP